ncbi:MAG: hypothetical protein IPG04_40640 [Polyangiaceae bacterium]|nr:hypothetical protein [Polyangiaceae bacterium]
MRDARTPAHPSGAGGGRDPSRPRAGGRQPPGVRRRAFSCGDVYCHGGREIGWDDGGPLACDSCHDALPESHGRFATSAGSCEGCHADASLHLDGRFDLQVRVQRVVTARARSARLPPGCCSSPTGLASARTRATSIQRSSTASARWRAAATATTCPDDLGDDGHIDGAAPADVVLRTGETYDPSPRTCTVGCHRDIEPGPAWATTAPRERATPVTRCRR